MNPRVVSFVIGNVQMPIIRDRYLSPFRFFPWKRVHVVVLQEEELELLLDADVPDDVEASRRVDSDVDD